MIQTVDFGFGRTEEHVHVLDCPRLNDEQNMTSPTSPTSPKERFERDGFVIIDGLVPGALFAELQAACARTVAKTRVGAWPHRRVVGRQFPPFDVDGAGEDAWGVQHVMHPDLAEPVFARWYASDELAGAVCELLDCGEGDLQMELFNLLINPESHAFALRWHRDDVKEDATSEEEVEALRLWHHGIQWNTALYEDSCLFVVPGSHKTPRTPEQRTHSETAEAPKDPMDMPGAIQVTIKPGQTVFYNNNILHCATYDPHAVRATLHASMGDTRGGTARARNVLQHGLRWMRVAQFRETLPEGRARAMLDRLLDMEGSVKDVGYSLSA